MSPRRLPSLLHLAPTAGPLEAPAIRVEALARLVLALQGTGSKLARLERAVVRDALRLTEGNQSAAARLLGIDRKALIRKMRRTPKPRPRRAKSIPSRATSKR
jgi:DNA-binding NtrC family response regulator